MIINYYYNDNFIFACVNFWKFLYLNPTIFKVNFGWKKLQFKRWGGQAECSFLFTKHFWAPASVSYQCYPVNYDLFIRCPSHIKIDEWHTTQTLKAIASFGLYLKLLSLIYDKNTIFANSAPKQIFNTSNNDLID